MRSILSIVACLYTYTYICVAQSPIFIADQTFRLEGENKFNYAFAEGDEIDLYVQELSGKQLKSVELVQWPDNFIFREYEKDSAITKKIRIPQTGIYQLRFKEKGLSKKVMRFTLHRTPSNSENKRMDTRVNWDIEQNPAFKIEYRSVPTGKKQELISLGGQVTVGASKFYTQKPVNAYQFTLPDNTIRWAYRVSVGQSVTEARRQDADKLKKLLQSGAVKIMGVQPETALGAFALGMAIDLTVSTSGEDVEYALLDYDNWLKFSKNKEYNAHIYQSAISVDVQRRSSPLNGSWYFAFKSDNWMDNIDINVDIEAVTEIQLFEKETFVSPSF